MKKYAGLFVHVFDMDIIDIPMDKESYDLVSNSTGCGFNHIATFVISLIFLC